MTHPPTFQKADNAQKADRSILLANMAPSASAHEHHEPSGPAAEHLPLVKVRLEPVAIAFDILSLLARFFGVSLLPSASSGAYVVSGAQANVAQFLQDLMVMMHHQAAAPADVQVAAAERRHPALGGPYGRVCTPGFARLAVV